MKKIMELINVNGFWIDPKKISCFMEEESIVERNGNKFQPTVVLFEGSSMWVRINTPIGDFKKVLEDNGVDLI